MKSPLDNLNLRPFEKRLVVVVSVVMFIVLNLWFVVPHFKDWGRVQFRMNKAQRTLAAFQAEVRQVPVYQARVRELSSENSTVPIEEQTLHFNNTREAVASTAGVMILNATKITTRTNQFFLDLTQSINLLCREQQLVDFLYNLGAGNSLIRVRDLGLKPDAARQNLNANVKLAASYQKRPAAKPAPAPAAAPGAAPKTKAEPAKERIPTSGNALPPPPITTTSTSKKP